MENKNVEEKDFSEETTEIAVANNNAMSVGLDWTNTEQMKVQYKLATALAKGNAIPDRFKNSPGDILIGVDIAARSNQPLAMILNNMYSVYGTIGFSGQYAISAVNNCGKFSPLKFEFTDNGGGGCIAYATRYSDNEICKSEEITIDLAKKEGWYDKRGSKWQVYPRQMMMYRAASFFVRAYCPEVMYGYQTVEELQDVNGYKDVDNDVVTVSIDSEVK